MCQRIIRKSDSGKHFNRALRVDKVTLEALERLLLEKFEMSLPKDYKLSDEASEAVLNLAKNPSTEALQHLMENKACSAYFERYQQFKQQVRDCHLGKLHSSG